MVLFVKVGKLKNKQEELEKKLSKFLSKNGGLEKKAEQNFDRNFSVDSEKEDFEKPRYVVKEEIKTETSKAEKENHEYNIGSKVIPAVGIVSVLFGVGFFLKYTFDHNLIDETGRVILGFIIGILFVTVGERLRKRFAGYSALLMGGGFAILYLAAKFGLIYNLYSNAIGFILMTIITFAAVAIAFRTNSRIIAFVALVGGFLNPFLASSGQANEMVLFNYILLLLAGMVFLA